MSLEAKNWMATNKILNQTQMCSKWPETPEQYGCSSPSRRHFMCQNFPPHTRIHTQSHHVYVGYYSTAADADNIWLNGLFWRFPLITHTGYTHIHTRLFVSNLVRISRFFYKALTLTITAHKTRFWKFYTVFNVCWEDTVLTSGFNTYAAQVPAAHLERGRPCSLIQVFSMTITVINHLYAPKSSGQNHSAI